jgi:hypothetical protein
MGTGYAAHIRFDNPGDRINLTSIYSTVPDFKLCHVTTLSYLPQGNLIGKKMAAENTTELVVVYAFQKGDKHHVSEEDLNKIKGISPRDAFLGLKNAEQLGYFIDVSTHDGKAWILSREGASFAKALLLT